MRELSSWWLMIAQLERVEDSAAPSRGANREADDVQKRPGLGVALLLVSRECQSEDKGHMAHL
ncbi:MAG: hypothetical protein ACFCU2_07085 [Acidimicrobiia bacterium]